MMKQGQAAFEFLSTYGWAVFAALAVIAALTTFGFTNLRSQIPSSCYLGTDFICEGATADMRGVVLLEFSPIDKVHLDKLICTYPDGTEIEQTYSSAPVLLPSSTYIMGCEETSKSLPAHKDKMLVRIVYHANETDALPQVSTGEVVATIVEDNLNLGLITTDLEAD